ncbi:MAG: 5-(carboxyamino)imidazole ribonucleotide mutase [Endomicrobium sp.]|jgi:5-(carboxyamino)imidazole ribonucleotide mutase|nr:5-(carboxyamino)imidazole ribonucleotide mutase [Endomicrobium sp.]
MQKKVDVAIIIGSKSDAVLINETVKTLDEFKVSYSLNIASAHRTVKHLKDCIKHASAHSKVFIAAAGMSAALPGVIASETILPVIGIPVKCDSFGLDSFFSMLQMPKGIPNATVSIGRTGAINAAILAVQIIALNDENLKTKLKNYRTKMMETIINENLILQKKGIKKYIEGLKYVD